jgi:NADPH-dependent 2,4-dienoyl-CoA reductase/sulfur reductase-like enzyme
VDGVPDDTSKRPPRVVVVGAGFAGFHCLQTLESLLPPGAAELVAVNPTDYMLYVPLLPEVAAAILEPRRVTPFHWPLTGPVAKAITRGYHLMALPSGRARVAADWLIDAVAGPPLVQFGLVSEAAVRLGDADRIG